MFFLLLTRKIIFAYVDLCVQDQVTYFLLILQYLLTFLLD